jgi:hypothetical protein
VNWHQHFADILVSGDPGEVAAAAAAATDAQRRGADFGSAEAAGKSAARGYRGAPVLTRRAAAPAGNWPEVLAGRLFSPPARWGWQAAPVAVAAEELPMPSARPVWVEPPQPDASGLHAVRSKAVSRVVRRVAFLVVAAFAFTTYQLVIEEQIEDLGGDSAGQVYQVALIVISALLVIGVLRAVGGVRAASASIRNYEQPYLAMRAVEEQRHEQALRDWTDSVRAHQARSQEAARVAAQRASGPLWFPVAPASEPTRVDVFGGDPRRHGWASLLVTLGSSVLAAEHRVTLLDLTGQDVGGGLLGVADASGLRTRRSEVDDVDLLRGLARGDIADCLGYVLTGRKDDTDRREERALAIDILRRVIDSLSGPLKFARLAAGVQVLRHGTGDDRLSADEVDRLVTVHLGEIEQNEWVTRQLRLIVSQLETLGTGAEPYSPLWTDDALSVVTTSGYLNDRKELIDRLVVNLAQRAMDHGRLDGFLVVAGVDHLGAGQLRVLSEHARQAGVRLVLMIDQPQGDLERTAGTGGTVCIMKMYNHRDANMAAEFIGKGHRFVISQVTRQVGKTFSDGGGDNFAATTNSGTDHKLRAGTRGRAQGVSDTRGHTWTGTRTWQTADNIGTSSTSARVYEFVVEPQEILGMPETSFILVDNSGQGRRVVMADGNPGICLLDRVSRTPAS